ncbi:uncharacterized protein DS421_19g668080 [Arachis hypogaea]|uniref:Aminotransferase-like plant mobile domain-containing protein n=1 Tax=Arachis hypogaea TaxID=3818 RepID=A0A6B9VET7_ARAHY|nr:uncharacterized protein DS421_19g668080 [Arachis hypogaea]
MRDDPARLYRLDGVAHIAGVINDEPQRCIRSMRRQQGMRLDERYVPYLQMAGLYHLARLNDRWFRLDEALVSAFVERWRPETHTFHIPFGEYFQIYIQGVRPAWVWFQELLGVIPPPSQVQKYAVNCSWFQEDFGECPDGVDEETVRRFARAYIMMLLGTQLFADKSGNRIHIRWLPYVARLEEMGTYSWGSAALAWLYWCMCRVANKHVVKLAGPLQLLQSRIFWRFPQFRPARYDTFSWPLASRWSGYNPSGSEKGPRVQMWRLMIDMLQDREFIWMPYSIPEVLQVVHPEALDPRHMALWRSVTSLIYFAVIEWHQIDRVLPQFGGVQPHPHPTLNIDYLMSKDDRGGDRWFPYALQSWHLHWESRAETVLRFDVVADSGPSHEFLEWWSQHGNRFLSPEMYLRDPRAVPIPVEASERGAGRVPDMDRVDDVPDRRWVERRARVGTRRSQREWRWLDHAMDEADDAGPCGGGRRGQGGRQRGRAMADHHGDHCDDDDDDQHGPWGGGMVQGLLQLLILVPMMVDMEASGHDQTLQESSPWVSPGSQWADFLASDTLDADFGGSHFLDEITTIMQEDVAARRHGQSSGTQAPLDVDLNEPPTTSVGDHFALGGTPPFAYTAASHSVARPSAAPVQPRPPTQPAPDEEEDGIEDKEPLIRRGHRTQVPRRCFTGSHLFR